MGKRIEVTELERRSIGCLTGEHGWYSMPYVRMSAMKPNMVSCVVSEECMDV